MRRRVEGVVESSRRLSMLLDGECDGMSLQIAQLYMLLSDGRVSGVRFVLEESRRLGASMLMDLGYWLTWTLSVRVRVDPCASTPDDARCVLRRRRRRVGSRRERLELWLDHLMAARI